MIQFREELKLSSDINDHVREHFDTEDRLFLSLDSASG